MKHFDNNSALAYVKQFIHDYNVQPGDVIIGAITPINIAGHHIVILPNLEFIQNSNGQNINRPSIITVATDLLTFKRLQRFEGNSLARAMAVKRAISIEKEGRVYSWDSYNCEDFSSEVQTGKPKSKQVQNVTTGVVAAGIVMTTLGLSKKNKATTYGGLALLFLAAFSNGKRTAYQSSI
jgi:hypothetical protein